MKKFTVFFTIITISFMFLSLRVSAEEGYFINSNGVTFSQDEYDFVSRLVYEGYQNFMEQNDFDFIFRNGISPTSIIEDGYFYPTNNIELYSTSHTTSSKTINIRKSCTSSKCLISVSARWLKVANTRSYDVIGAYLHDTTLLGLPNTNLLSEAGLESITDVKLTSTGFGVSAKLPSKSESDTIEFNQMFYVEPRGTVYASYQHAQRNVTLAQSKQYSISLSGYGNVFDFSSAVKDYYDGMGGVYINL